MSASVERCDLAPGLTVPRIITGMWQVADMEREGRTLDLDAAAGAMELYVNAGLTAFDMADHYGSAEDIAGKLSRRTLPSSVQLFTKWVPKPGPISRADVTRAVETSLRRLRTDHLDLLQFHAWVYEDPSWLDALRFLHELVGQGLISHLGLTNFDTEHLLVALDRGIDIVSNQICLSLLDRRAAEMMQQVCLSRNVKLLAYGSLAGGFLTKRWLGQPAPRLGDLETHSQMKYWRFINAAGSWDMFQSLLAAVHRVAERNGVSMANVAARYVLDQPAVCGVIIGARLSQSEHIADTLRLFEFSLDSESRGVLDSAVGDLHPLPGDCGDEYRKPPFLTAAGDLSDHL